MRLTLRTLLAHLDNTLDAEDNAAIAAKLRESEFASHLVRRINACMESNQISAPSPVSTSTADDPNRIGEYLDSVLSAEQVAEIERICLESDGHLAEVAACHQILTIVLGHPAEIPPVLRARVYALGQNQSTQNFPGAASNGTSSGSTQRSASIADEAMDDDSISQTLASYPTASSNFEHRAGSMVPVGLDDSGVSDAPTRLRTAGLAASSGYSSESANLGSRRIRASEISDFTGRPSRVVPWLVSLALVASFLFVAVQAFSPLLRKRTAALDDDKIVSTEPSSVLPQTEAPTMADPAIPDPADDLRDNLLEQEMEAAPPIAEQDPLRTIAATQTPTPSLPATIEERSTDSILDPMPPVAPAVQEVMPTMPAPTMQADDEEGEKEEVVKEVFVSTTTLVSDGSLFLMRKPDGEAHVLAKKLEPIPNGSDVICPPLYRDRLLLADQFDLTMIGPAKLMIEQLDADTVIVAPSVGRYMLSPLPTPTEAAEPTVVSPQSDESPSRITILFGDAKHELTFLGPDSLAAIEIIHSRAPGADPEDAASSTAFLEVLAVQGSLGWKTDDADEMVLSIGEYLQWSPTTELIRSLASEVPPWMVAPKELAGSIESSARDGLLSLVRGNESIELSLREAIGFRRAEVGALAAQTLVLLDRPAVYFGADGILSDIKQKPYWETHFSTLVAAIDRGPDSAANVREAIDQMDAAESAAIYRMLWLFSNPQLEAGSDSLLISSLDHSNMTVRVLAAENLRKITGTTLFFKPENETAPRRASDIKKWEPRLRKGDIRWPETN